MNTIECVLPTINICFASNDIYCEHLATAIYSLICNANMFRCYDILIVNKDISIENKNKILNLIHNYKNFSIRFINVSNYEKFVSYNIGAYYSIETNYRLFLLSELFNNYDKIIYLDSDIVVTGDISKLFDISVNGYLVGAIKDSSIKYYEISKRAIYFENNYIYNINTYRTKFLNLKFPNDYFNAGVLLINLKECRKTITFHDVMNTLHSKNFIYNDQDVLNILFNGKVKFLDVIWNYMNNIESFLKNNLYKNYYIDLKRQNYNIIHYIGQLKPWNSKVYLDEYYHKYNMLMNEL